MINVHDEVIKAQTRIKNYLQPTPLVYAEQLSKITEANVYLKLETMQPTASFKIRGAFNKLLSLTSEQSQRGVVTASTGNHGAAVAYACRKLDLRVEVFVPKAASIAKVNAIKSYNATIHFYGDDSGATEQYAREYAEQHNKVYISPYNDNMILSGQGTIGYELLQQHKKIDTILVPVGGGGLIAGIAGYIKPMDKKIQIIGSLPENSPVMAECVKAGKIIDLNNKPTLSDATAGNIDADSVTFPLCQAYVDAYIAVSEDEIKAAMRLLIEKEHLLIEGSVGTAVAGLIKSAEQLKQKTVVIIVSGANISIETLKKAIS